MKTSSPAVAASLQLLSEHLKTRRNSQKPFDLHRDLRPGPVLELLRCATRLLADPTRPFPSAGRSTIRVPEHDSGTRWVFSDNSNATGNRLIEDSAHVSKLIASIRLAVVRDTPDSLFPLAGVGRRTSAFWRSAKTSPSHRPPSQSAVKKSSPAVAASLQLLSEHLTNRRNSQKRSIFTVI